MDILFRTFEDNYRAYHRFLKKGKFKKAYQCLEILLHEFPDDEELMDEIVNLSIFDWRNYEKAKPWLIKLTKIRSIWEDYALLSRVEAELGNNIRAEEYLNISKKLLGKWQSPEEKRMAKEIFSEIEDLMKYNEWRFLSETKAKEAILDKEKVPFKERVDIQDAQTKNNQIVDTSSSTHIIQAVQEELISKRKLKMEIQKDPTYHIPVTILTPGEEILNTFQYSSFSSLKDIKLFIDYTRLAIQGSFDELLCLNVINNVERYWYQIETVKKVLKYFRGRVLLCDEVGLGKTIEAGMVIKEYLMRGMVRNVLILTPPSLVSQWKEEMETKFGIEFMTTDNLGMMDDLGDFWKGRYLIASLNMAKSKKNMPLVIKQFYDLVVVDEAHHLRNRSTLAWKLINQIQKRFILLLSATPLQNDLIELFNLITLLKPGQFKTEKLFRQEYLMKGNLRVPANKEKLRGLLREVMIRNTRSAIDLKLPRRYATTMRIEPTEVERKIYKGLNDYLRNSGLKRQTINLLLKEAGSSPFALKETFHQMYPEGDEKGIIELIDSLEDVSKGKVLIDIIKRNPDEKKVIFTHYLRSMEYITSLLERNGFPFVTFKGTLSIRDKDAAIEHFRNEVPILVSTESGGEGRNLQFCNTMINFDLPWNPMRIEQRIGRLHRIGQTRDVFIFNLSLKETIEDYIIDILDNKINMFEMVIGEIEPILGHLGKDEDFEDIIMEIWLKSSTDRELEAGFERLGQDLVKAKTEYLKAKAFDEEIFGEDYEI